MHHYTQFWVLYHGIHVPLGMFTGPVLTHGRAGYDTRHGLVAFLHPWARALAGGHRFTGKAWAGKLGRGGTLAGSKLIPIHLRELAHWRSHRRLLERWGAYARHGFLHAVTVRAHRT